MQKVLLIIGLLAGMLCAAAADAQQVKVVNSLADFERFWTAAQGKPFEEQERLWSAFEAKYADIYEGIVFPRSDPNWRQRRLDKLQAAFARLPQTAAAIIAMMRDADAIAVRGAARFSRAFPDMEPGTPVVFIPISTFNVAVRGADLLPSYGRWAVVFGVDFVLDNHDALEVVFAHEFFHVYHFTRLRDRQFNSTMATPLWLEGFATYVSSALNPGVDPLKVFMDPELGAACNGANLAQWSRDYLDVAGQDVDSPSLQLAWFRASGDVRPRRRGYCVGFHVARLLAANNKLADMAAWDETVYQPKVMAALRELAGAGSANLSLN